MLDGGELGLHWAGCYHPSSLAVKMLRMAHREDKVRGFRLQATSG